MKGWKELFHFFIEARNSRFVQDEDGDGIIGLIERWEPNEVARWNRIVADFRERDVKVVHSHSQCKVYRVEKNEDVLQVYYIVRISWGLRQGNSTGCYDQSWIENRVCTLKQKDWCVLQDRVIEHEGSHPSIIHPFVEAGFDIRNPNERRAKYNRKKAVEYAQIWWNSYNPKFRRFDVDCTNYVSQCLWAGGAPMKYASDRAKGWWYRFEQPVNWSFSWSVAHSLRWFLPSNTSGLRGNEVSSADQLQLGDVICYDFDGDGKWDHTTIVVGKDAVGMPLVNAHTTNSQNRAWAYKDSYAWTDKIKYKFFHIDEEF